MQQERLYNHRAPSQKEACVLAPARLALQGKKFEQLMQVRGQNHIWLNLHLLLRL